MLDHVDLRRLDLFFLGLVDPGFDEEFAIVSAGLVEVDFVGEGLLEEVGDVEGVVAHLEEGEKQLTKMSLEPSLS